MESLERTERDERVPLALPRALHLYALGTALRLQKGLIPARKVPPVAHLFDTVAPRLGQHAAHVARSQHLEVRRAHATGSVRAHHDVVELVEGVGGRRRAARLGGWMAGGGGGERERGKGDGVGAGAWCARLNLYGSGSGSGSG